MRSSRTVSRTVSPRLVTALPAPGRGDSNGGGGAGAGELNRIPELSRAAGAERVAGQRGQKTNSAGMPSWPGRQLTPDPGWLHSSPCSVTHSPVALCSDSPRSGL